MNRNSERIPRSFLRETRTNPERQEVTREVEDSPQSPSGSFNGKYKRVPAVDKCFAMLHLLAGSEQPLGISDMACALQINKSTVFNLAHTLSDLAVLERVPQNKFRFGTTLYLLGKAAAKKSELIHLVHPYLQEINQRTKLSAFLGIRSGRKAVIVDKVDSAFDIKISSEVGMEISLLAGAGGKALLSLLPDNEVEEILSSVKLPRFTPNTCTGKSTYKRMIQRVREEGIALDREEYIDGVFAFAVPIRSRREGLQAAIWAVGLKNFVSEPIIPEYSVYLKQVAAKIESRLFVG